MIVFIFRIGTVNTKDWTVKMQKARRITSHIIETESVNKIRSIIDADGRGLFREFSGRDYGIDAMVEVFDKGCITGKFAMLQCKGKGEKIKTLIKTPEYVSCSNISSANISYLFQGNVLVIIVYGDITEDKNFYFADLKSVVSDEQRKKLSDDNKTVTVRIPIVNNAKSNIDLFFKLIDDFFDEKLNK